MLSGSVGYCVQRAGRSKVWALMVLLQLLFFLPGNYAIIRAWGYANNAKSSGKVITLPEAQY